MKRLLCALFLLGPAVLARAENPPAAIIVTGAGGSAEYAETFAGWADDWRKACASANLQPTMLGGEKSDPLPRAQLQQALETTPKDSADPLWLVLLGHGTSSGKEGKFNLSGDDLSTADLAAWLKPFTRPVVLIASFSASGVWLQPLAGPGRIIVTATKSGGENNYSRFGGFLAQAIAAPAADLDHDGQTSLLEAWLSAAHETAAFYESAGRLATEHSLLDDNGDGRGTPADWFQGLRLVKKSKDQAAADGLRARQIQLVPSTAERALSPALRAERDALERDLAQLRETKSSLPENAYYEKMEALLLRLARLYHTADSPSRQ